MRFIVSVWLLAAVTMATGQSVRKEVEDSYELLKDASVTRKTALASAEAAAAEVAQAEDAASTAQSAILEKTPELEPAVQKTKTAKDEYETIKGNLDSNVAGGYIIENSWPYKRQMEKVTAKKTNWLALKNSSDALAADLRALNDSLAAATAAKAQKAGLAAQATRLLEEAEQLEDDKAAAYNDAVKTLLAQDAPEKLEKAVESTKQQAQDAADEKKALKDEAATAVSEATAAKVLVLNITGEISVLQPLVEPAVRKTRIAEGAYGTDKNNFESLVAGGHIVKNSAQYDQWVQKVAAKKTNWEALKSSSDALAADLRALNDSLPAATAAEAQKAGLAAQAVTAAGEACAKVDRLNAAYYAAVDALVAYKPPTTNPAATNPAATNPAATNPAATTTFGPGTSGTDASGFSGQHIVSELSKIVGGIVWSFLNWISVLLRHVLGMINNVFDDMEV